MKDKSYEKFGGGGGGQIRCIVIWEMCKWRIQNLERGNHGVLWVGGCAIGE